MTTLTDIQQLNPGAILYWFVLDATPIGGGIVRFHGMNDSSLIWQGNQYDPWPIEAEGFAMTSDQQPTPKLRVGNINSYISQLCLQFQDMVGAKLYRYRSFAKYLDAVNFPGGNPSADPNEMIGRPELWFIQRKAMESRDAVEFDLSSALNFNGVKLPRRQIIANQCSFVYRGPLCAYTGPAVATITDTPTTNPALDRCGKRYQSCKLRQWPDGVLNYGGFLAAGLVRT